MTHDNKTADISDISQAGKASRLMLWSAQNELQHCALQATLPTAQLPPGWHGTVSRDGLAVTFDHEQSCLSSAVVNGGLVRSNGYLNMHLREIRPHDAGGPAALITRTIDAFGLPSNSVAMMTGAWMRSMRLASARIEGHLLTLMLTAGTADARRAGDRAEQRDLRKPLVHAGTINMALASTLPLTPAAMAETLTTLTEAKAAVLQSLGIVSPVSGAIATGTGTDVTAVFCPPDDNAIEYTGKHTIFGEVAAQLVIEALADSLVVTAEAGSGS